MIRVTRFYVWPRKTFLSPLALADLFADRGEYFAFHAAARAL